jgi:hypothetical protein
MLSHNIYNFFKSESKLINKIQQVNKIISLFMLIYMVCLFSNHYNSFGKRIGVRRHWMYGGLGLLNNIYVVLFIKSRIVLSV